MNCEFAIESALASSTICRTRPRAVTDDEPRRSGTSPIHGPSMKSSSSCVIEDADLRSRAEGARGNYLRTPPLERARELKAPGCERIHEEFASERSCLCVRAPVVGSARQTTQLRRAITDQAGNTRLR
jgi:hypothetical protein